MYIEKYIYGKIYSVGYAFSGEILAFVSTDSNTLIRGRMSSDEAVRSVTTRITLSSPGCSFVMRARSYLHTGVVSERRKQSEPTCNDVSDLVLQTSD